MRAKLENELHTLLLPYSISPFRIFRDWLIKKAALSADIRKLCYFEGYQEEYDIWLNVKRLNQDSREKLLAFLGQNTIENNIIKLDENLLFNQLLPEFIIDLKSNQFFTLQELAAYQLFSKNRIEEYIVKKMTELAEQLLSQISCYPGEQPVLNKQLTSFIRYCKQYFSVSETNYQWQAGMIVASFNSIKGLIRQDQKLIKNQSFLTTFESLQQKAALFERNHNAQERCLNKQFTQEIDNFLMRWQMTASKCDIFEHMLFELAGSSFRPSNIQYNAHSNSLRVYLWFHNPEDVEEEVIKLQQFFKENGDPSALIQMKKRRRDMEAENELFAQLMKSDKASTLSLEEIENTIKATRQPFGYHDLYNGINLRLMIDGPFAFTIGKPPVEYSFSCNAKLLREVIWPKIKNHIEELAKNNPERLKPYQQECEAYFKSRLPSVSSNLCAFFKTPINGHKHQQSAPEKSSELVL